MDLRTGFYEHPYAWIVTVVFLFAVLVTGAYSLGLIPGIRTTQPVLDRLTTVTAVLLVTTVASWIAVVVMATGQD
jgi:uncharacterized membrane protein